MTKEVSKEIIFERKVENVKEAENWAPVCSETAPTTRRLANESNSTKIPLKRQEVFYYV